VLPIPGTTRLANLKANISAMDLSLDDADVAALDRLADQVQGTRYNERGMALLNG
jgi:aryl-alcohol dehydrogenase-like predicted oxidoreductase